MNKYIILILILSVILLFTNVIIRFIFREKKEEKQKIKNRNGYSYKDRGNKRKGFNISKNNLEKKINEKADVKQKYKLETMYKQAGYDFSYGEVKIYSICTAIIFPGIMFILLNNIFIALLFVIIGYQIPKQVLGFKANRNVKLMEKQIGSFMKMIIERYKTQNDIALAMAQSLEDFEGSEPFYSNFKKAIVSLNKGIPTENVLEELAKVTGSSYLLRFSDYYKLSLEITREESKISLFTQAYEQYEDDRKLKITLKEKIAGPVREAYIMIVAIPIFMVYQCIATDGYLDFMLNDVIGQIGIAATAFILLGTIWFVNTKIGAPID